MHCYISLCLIEHCWWDGAVAHWFYFSVWNGGEEYTVHQGACKQEQARLTATAYSCLPEQIYRLLAQCKDYQRELCGPALALSRFIDLLLFQIQNVHSSHKQDILGLWVPSIERWQSVLSITWADNGKESDSGAGEFLAVTRREETWSTWCGIAVTCIHLACWSVIVTMSPAITITLNAIQQWEAVEPGG